MCFLGHGSDSVSVRRSANTSEFVGIWVCLIWRTFPFKMTQGIKQANMDVSYAESPKSCQKPAPSPAKDIHQLLGSALKSRQGGQPGAHWGSRAFRVPGYAHVRRHRISVAPRSSKHSGLFAGKGETSSPKTAQSSETEELSLLFGVPETPSGLIPN